MSNINNEYQRGADDIWSALETLKENDYDIEEWIEENSPSDTFLEVVKLKAIEEAKGYGLRVSIDDINCTPPTEVYNNPLKKRMTYNPPKSRMTYNPPKSRMSFDATVSGLKVGCEVFDTRIEEYAILISLDHNIRSFALVATLTDGTTTWFTRADKIMPTTYVTKTVEGLMDDNKRRKETHVIRDGDIVKIIVVPSMHADMDVGSYQKISEHFDGKYYIRDGKNVEYMLTEDMFELME